MSFVPIVVGAVVAGVGVLLEGISASISGIQSTKTKDTSIRNSLLAASATVGIGVLMFIISLVLFFFYRASGKKSLAIAGIVFSAIALALFITGATIAGVQSNNYKKDPQVYHALRTAAILVAIGIVLILIGYGILYTVLIKRLRGFA